MGKSGGEGKTEAVSTHKDACTHTHTHKDFFEKPGGPQPHGKGVARQGGARPDTKAPCTVQHKHETNDQPPPLFGCGHGRNGYGECGTTLNILMPTGPAIRQATKHPSQERGTWAHAPASFFWDIFGLAKIRCPRPEMRCGGWWGCGGFFPRPRGGDHASVGIPWGICWSLTGANG